MNHSGPPSRTGSQARTAARRTLRRLRSTRMPSAQNRVLRVLARRAAAEIAAFNDAISMSFGANEQVFPE